MRFKWLTLVLIILGASLLIFSSGIEPKASGTQTIGFKISGLILLMIGVYRASRRVDPKINEKTEALKEIEEKDENQDRRQG